MYSKTEYDGKNHKVNPKNSIIVNKNKKTDEKDISNEGERDYMINGRQIKKQEEDEIISGGLFSLSNLQGQRSHTRNQKKDFR